MTKFDAVLFSASVMSGAVASVTGFGIGSMLTPLLALQAGTKLAVAAISIPHFIATAIRFWIIRSKVSRKIIFSFGLASALGGLIGAVLYSKFQSSFLTLIFGILLIFAGLMGMSGASRKMRFQGAFAWIAGVLSGGFGGLVGNQGGIRSAALMTFDLSKEELVATATGIGIIVDLVRMPVYLYSESTELTSAWLLILIATLGVVFGTLLGIKFLQRISENIFRKLLGVLIFILGISMLTASIQR